jgi:hypothetical protein
VPGLWLKGDSVTTPVTDWSFTDQIPQIKIQTQTPFLLPHSVIIWCAVYNGNLYVTSYRGRQWVENIVRDPHVRLKIADKVFDRTLSIVNDPVEKAGVLQAKGRKYPQWKVPAVAAATVFSVNPAYRGAHPVEHQHRLRSQLSSSPGVSVKTWLSAGLRPQRVHG